MSGTSDIFDEAAVDIFMAAADPGLVTFNPADGDPGLDCYIDVRKDIQFESPGTDTRIYSQGTVLEYLVAQIGRAARIDESFTDGITIWKIKGVLTNDGRFARVEVKS